MSQIQHYLQVFKRKYLTNVLNVILFIIDMKTKHETSKYTITLYGVTKEDIKRFEKLKEKTKIGRFALEAILEKLDREEK